ncbi:MAG: hypothetical protein GY705_29840 [Bacteroidetes bacterium]|nr:hypothetical protein [Bacteroidota bacterium]
MALFSTVIAVSSQDLYFAFKQRSIQKTLLSLPDNIRNRVWVHRVNSIEKAQEAASLFSGIELDVVFDSAKNVFDINHPPTISINLSFEKLVSTLEDTNLSYWLDIKTLKYGHAERAITRLVHVSTTLNINANNIIVESNNIKLLKKFTQAGFQTSYYLPQKKLDAFVLEENKRHKTKMKELAKLKKIIQCEDFHFISSHSKFLPFISKHLALGKKILLWNPKIDPNSTSAVKQIENIFQQDNRIDVLLVQLPSKYHR